MKNIIRNNALFFMCTGVVLLLAACAGDKEISNTDRKTTLKNIAENAILPAYEDFKEKANDLEKAVVEFGGNTNQNTLENVQLKWIEAAISWKKASVFIQGPVEDLFLASAIDYQSVHYPNIEKAIIDGKKIDNEYINSKGSSLKGLKAIEYLIYGDTTQTGKILDLYTHKTGKERLHYLQALTENLHINAGKIKDAWSSDKGNYLADFEQADGREAGASLGVLINKLVSQLNMLKDEKLGAPAGRRNNGTPQPELAEGIPSGQSFILLKSEVQGFESVITAHGKGGIDYLLDQLDAKSGDQLLSKQISEQFVKIYDQIDAIHQPLPVAVVDEKEKVALLYNDLKQLQVLLEVDLVNNLGILLTFSDSDGD